MAAERVLVIVESPAKAKTIEGYLNGRGSRDFRVKASVGHVRDLAPPPVQRVSRDGELPLSFAQQRLWFLNQLETGQSEFNISTSYNMPAALRIKGDLNTNALRKAFQALVARHESLRTSFLIDDGTGPAVTSSTVLT